MTTSFPHYVPIGIISPCFARKTPPSEHFSDFEGGGLLSGQNENLQKRQSKNSDKVTLCLNHKTFRQLIMLVSHTFVSTPYSPWTIFDINVKGMSKGISHL